MRRLSIILMTALLGLTLMPADRASAEEPGLSGRILSPLSGLHPGVLIGCQMAADCRAWVESDCDPALTDRDPSLSASIVDVAGLARRSEWIFEHAEGAAAYAAVQYWRRDCTEIEGAAWGTRQCRVCPVRLPAAAKWMTVTGYTYNPWAVWLPIPSTSGPLTLNWALRKA